MNILNNLKWNGVCFGLCVAGSLLWSRAAKAEVTLFDKDGWSFSFDGRVAAFLSVGTGDDFPMPTTNPAGGEHSVMGSKGSNGAIPEVGWKSSTQQKADNKYFGMRVRSGMLGNILGFGLKRQINAENSIKAYVSIWSTIETLGRDKWAPVDAEAREGYFTSQGPWGSATLGRTLGLFGRMSTEINFLYGHGYGVGYPCSDALGPTCGHIGTGVMYPGLSAGGSYSTPSLGGLQLHVGLYDPIVFSGSPWTRAPMLRPEGAISFETPIGDGKLRIEGEGLYQTLGRVTSTTDPVTMMPVKKDDSTSVWGVAGGGRVEIGPVRLGAAAFRGRGIGLDYALHRTSATLEDTSGDLRMFSGFYGQAAIVVGNVHLAAGGGVGAMDQLPADRANIALSTFRRQIGISAAVYYHVTSSVVLGLDYFRYQADWYGAPNSVIDPTTSMPVATGGPALKAEKQALNFINAGVTYHW